LRDDAAPGNAAPAGAPAPSGAPILRPSDAPAAPNGASASIAELAFDRRADDAARALADRVGGAPWEALGDHEQDAFLGDARAVLEAAGVRQLIDRTGGSWVRELAQFTVTPDRDLYYVAYYGQRDGGREFLGGVHLHAFGLVDARVSALLLGHEPDNEPGLIRSVSRVPPELAAYLEDEHLDVFLTPDELHGLADRASAEARR
jgi:hypothetical protein